MFTLGKPVQKTDSNAHYWTENGLIADLNLFFTIYENDFEKTSNTIGKIIYCILIVCLGFLTYKIDLTQSILSQFITLSPMIVRIILGVLIVVILIAWFLSDGKWINKQTSGEIIEKVLFYRLSQETKNRDEIVKLFNSKNFDEFFAIENDEESNVYITIYEDKKWKIFFVFLGEYDNYVPLPMADVAILQGQDYEKFKTLFDNFAEV